MSLTLSTAAAQVRSFLNEPSAVFWSDAEIQYWIKEGCTDFSSKSLLVESTVSIPLVASQITYSSTDVAALSALLEPYVCLYNDGVNNWKGLIRMDIRMIGNEAANTAGDPRMYAVHDSSIWIWPPPSSTIVAAGAYLSLLYSKVTDDITLIHDEYQHIPLLYAKAQCKYKDQKFAEGNALMSLYTGFANFERQDKHLREADTLDMFKIKPKGVQQGVA